MPETPTPRHSGPLNLNQGVVPQRDTWQGQETFFLDYILGVEGILLHLVDRSKYLLNIVQCIGQPPQLRRSGPKCQ